ncbi:MAG: efflux RND transporter permease subunit [Candidatus Glassbacteria bacterium]|nr:efflux RND transporter permease subunit [Candidatus Glassbacteria bacterium]
MIKWALKNPHLVVVSCLMIFVIGVVSVRFIPADLLPIYDTPAVQIVTFYPGMPPEVMERDIMSRIERWTGQSVGIEHQEGKAMLGVSVVKDFFREGISLETAMSQVTSYAMSDLFYLPPGTIPPMVMPFDPTAALPLCLVSVSSPTMSESELYDVAYFELRNRLQSIQGVIAPAVYGGTLRRILAYVDREKLEVRGLSPMDVVQALKEQNVFIPAGNIKAGGTDFQIFSNSMPESVEDLNAIPIRVTDGSLVLVGDVGRVEDSHQIQTNIVRVNGRRQVYIPIYRQPGANTIQIVNSIRSQLTRILQRLREMDTRAADLSLEVVLDQSIYVRDSINGLQLAALLGAVLAGLIVFLFLRSFRLTGGILLVIPLSVLGAFIGLYYTKSTINTMTLGGLALAIGILIDQSIVVLENTVRHRSLGKSPYQAALDGAREVWSPLLVATLTFMAVFYPIVFLSGTAKYLFTPLALAASFAIITSYLLSITLIPVYCARFIPEVKPSEAAGVKPASALERNYNRLFKRVLKRRGATISVAAAAFLLALFLLYNTGTELFPRIDAGQFTIFARMPTGTRIEVTEETIKQVEQHIIGLIGEPDPEYPKLEQHEDSELQILISNIGVLMDWPAAYTPNTGAMDAFLLVQLKRKFSSRGTFEIVEILRRELREKFPDVEFAFDTGGMLTAALNFGEPSPVHIQVSGSNYGTAHEIAQIIAGEIKESPGAADVRIAQRLDYPIVEVTVDRVKAAYLGLTMEDVIKNMVTATNSSINFDPAFWIDHRNGNHYFIGAQYREESLNSFETIREIPLINRNSGEVVPLRNVATFKRKTGPAVINHRDITRVIDIYANVKPGWVLGDLVADIEKRLASSREIAPLARESSRGKYYEVSGETYQGKGYSFTTSGEIQVMQSSFSQFGLGLFLAIVLVYLIMVGQFRSFLDPLIVLTAVPLGLIGVAATLFFTGSTLNIQSFMGIIMMVGIVVEYSILLVDFANRRVEQGVPVEMAVREAGAVRLRPIMMTSLTTVLALTPMGLGLGGGESNIPLARAIIGAVLAAAILSLFVVPVIYLSLKRSRVQI